MLGRREPRPQGQLLQVHQRDAQRHRGFERAFRPQDHLRHQRHGGRRRLRAGARRPTTSCWSTTAPRRSRCRSCRCSAVLARHRRPHPRRPTSARCGATSPTCSAPPRKASRASARSTGGWSTRWRRARSSTRRWPRAAKEFAAKSGRAAHAQGIKLTPLARSFTPSGVDYGSLAVEFDRAARVATLTLRGPQAPPPASVDALAALGAEFWPLKLARELDDAILHIRAQRVRRRRDRVQIVRRPGGGARLRAVPRCAQRPLAGARDPALVEARAQARRPHLALAGDAHRAGFVLCRARWRKSLSPPIAPTC